MGAAEPTKRKSGAKSAGFPKTKKPRTKQSKKVRQVIKINKPQQLLPK